MITEIIQNVILKPKNYVVITDGAKVIEILDTTGFENQQLMNLIMNKSPLVLPGIRDKIVRLSSKRIPFEVYSIESNLTINALEGLKQEHLYELITENGHKIFGR